MSEPVTVSELIKLLGEMPPDVPVELEGCDCINAAGGVEVMEHNGHVLITMEA